MAKKRVKSKPPTKPRRKPAEKAAKPRRKPKKTAMGTRARATTSARGRGARTRNTLAVGPVRAATAEPSESDVRTAMRRALTDAGHPMLVSEMTASVKQILVFVGTNGKLMGMITNIVNLDERNSGEFCWIENRLRISRRTSGP